MTADNLPTRRERAALDGAFTSDALSTMDVEQLTDAGAKIVRAYAEVEHVAVGLMRQLAEVIWALRLQFDDPRGQSQAYRDAASEVYRRAGVAPDSEERAMTNVRWHIGNLQRERLDAQQLKALGLKPDGPRVRKRESQEAIRVVAATHRALKSLPKAGSAPTSRSVGDTLRLAASVTQILTRAQPEVITDEMTPEQREVLDAHYAAAMEQLKSLRSLIKKANKR
ncbi:hypothetical protein [Streptomyces sp. CB03911]|uniref:hypothetical protein n=1 Tax=Streptomyces sp. CB03911 TaxID=1804758 RepID=UPI00093D784D|nr:hypothetical protein [Streptomyces sp. CB03911]OKI19300.1 hypothetical protein A6A07_07300 [Streptomyces sp. CB03911]